MRSTTKPDIHWSFRAKTEKHDGARVISELDGSNAQAAIVRVGQTTIFLVKGALAERACRVGIMPPGQFKTTTGWTVGPDGCPVVAETGDIGNCWSSLALPDAWTGWLIQYVPSRSIAERVITYFVRMLSRAVKAAEEEAMRCAVEAWQ